MLLAVGRIAVVMLGCVIAGTSSAQEAFPSKPLRIVVPWPPGGPPDLMARLFAPTLSEQLGKPVVVENRGGATGTIGTDLVARSGSDGYTLLMTSNQPLVIAPAMFKTPYDPVRDLTPVAAMTEDMIVLVANASLGLSSLADLIAMARSHPGKITYSTAGNGSMGHLGAELMKLVAGIDLTHVPYQGTVPATAAVLSGQVALSLPPLQQAGPHIKSGKLKALGVTGTRPTPFMPDVQPLMAQGLPGVVVTSWMSTLLGPRTPPAIVAAWRNALQRSMKDPAVLQKLQAARIQLQWQEADQLSVMIASDLAKWRKVVSAAKLAAN